MLVKRPRLQGSLLLDEEGSEWDPGGRCHRPTAWRGDRRACLGRVGRVSVSTASPGELGAGGAL